ncbi:jupiter microtubule associated homolog 1-like [Macrobrachium rosenbergii]|uniref:jupiter microtubule associated homolog 1-like n=1 Tax=Macrobrachium rosenbergii TaxID=79674 RepID=UPI0034D79F81
MSTTTTFVGISDNQRISSRVLKPPGGGSSISFDDDFESRNTGSKSTQVQAAPQKNEEQQSPNAEITSDSSPSVTPEGDATNSAMENSSPSDTNTATDKGVDLNGAVTKEASGSSSPSLSKLDTQARLFGKEPPKENTNPRLRDHQRSSIFF